MIVKDVPAADLIPYENNPRDNDTAVDMVARSINEFGFKVPLVITADNIIVCGHTRLKAALSIGLKTVPCIIADDLTPEQIKAFRLVDNKTADISDWDMDKLQLELEELSKLGIDMEEFLFDYPDKDVEEDGFDAAAAAAEITEPESKPGQIWALGRHRLMCGDSTQPADMSLLMDGRKARLIVTDPPYNVNYDDKLEHLSLCHKATGERELNRILNDSMDGEQFLDFLEKAYRQMLDASEPGAAIYVFHSEQEGVSFRIALAAAGWEQHQCLIWVKNSFVLGRQDYHWQHEPILYGWRPGAAHYFTFDRTQATVIDDAQPLDFKHMKKGELVELISRLYEERAAIASSVLRENRPTVSEEHPTMKPVRLCGRLIANSSRKGDVVLDSFGGSGSTLIAAEQLERVCYMMELAPINCDVIKKRWEQFTGSKCTFIGTD